MATTALAGLGVVRPAVEGSPVWGDSDRAKSARYKEWVNRLMVMGADWVYAEAVAAPATAGLHATLGAQEMSSDVPCAWGGGGAKKIQKSE